MHPSHAQATEEVKGRGARVGPQPRDREEGIVHPYCSPSHTAGPCRTGAGIRLGVGGRSNGCGPWQQSTRHAPATVGDKTGHTGTGTMLKDGNTLLHFRNVLHPFPRAFGYFTIIVGRRAPAQWAFPSTMQDRLLGLFPRALPDTTGLFKVHSTC